MYCSLRLDKIQLIILGALIVNSFSFCGALAQESDTNTGMQQTKFERKVIELDELLNTTIPASLTGLSLTGATFLMRVIKSEEDDILKKQIFSAKKNLSKADLSGAYLINADVRGANLSYSNLYKANLNSADLTSSDLSNANLRNSILVNAVLAKVNLENADLTNAGIWRTNMNNCMHHVLCR